MTVETLTYTKTSIVVTILINTCKIIVTIFNNNNMQTYAYFTNLFYLTANSVSDILSYFKLRV